MTRTTAPVIDFRIELRVFAEITSFIARSQAKQRVDQRCQELEEIKETKLDFYPRR